MIKITITEAFTPIDETCLSSHMPEMDLARSRATGTRRRAPPLSCVWRRGCLHALHAYLTKVPEHFFQILKSGNHTFQLKIFVWIPLGSLTQIIFRFFHWFYHARSQQF